jgi:hypothetical protein
MEPLVNREIAILRYDSFTFVSRHVKVIFFGLAKFRERAK